jgi:hypothetical protein
VAGLSLFLLVVAGLVTWRVAGSEPYVAPTPTKVRRHVQPAQAAETLSELERAVGDRDAAAARALAPQGDDTSARLLGAIVENAAALHVRDFTARYVDEEGALTDAGAWEAAVDTTWQFAGFDAHPAHAEVLFRFEDEGGHVALASVGGGDRRTPLWLSGPLRVRRTAQTLVMVDGPARETAAYADRARAAVPVVRRVLPRWPGRLVVEVPASLEDLEAALDARPGEYANIAAVTTTVDGTVAAGSPVHVFVNPEVFGELRPRGAQVVMSHEAVHVATGAATSAMPLWLLEGFADYVALRDVDLPVSTTAGQIIRQVRRHGPPAALPGPAEFDTTTSHLGAAYESAWLACRVLAEARGEQALLRFYRRVDAGAPVGQALEGVFGLTEAQFTRRWRERLTDLAA